jgi:hypothetical protein
MKYKKNIMKCRKKIMSKKHKLHHGGGKLTHITNRSEKLVVEIMKYRKYIKNVMKIMSKHKLHQGGSTYNDSC